MAVLKFRQPVATLWVSWDLQGAAFSVAVVNKQSGSFRPYNLVAKLGEVAAFGTYLKFVVLLVCMYSQ